MSKRIEHLAQDQMHVSKTFRFNLLMLLVVVVVLVVLVVLMAHVIITSATSQLGLESNNDYGW